MTEFVFCGESSWHIDLDAELQHCSKRVQTQITLLHSLLD